jgi:lipoate-protein ligase A
MEIFCTEYSSPAENLACDEALLDYCEAHPDHDGFLRFWESKKIFVVLGYSKSVKEEVDEQVCSETHTPILRRCSGGGTVLQGPGSFNYALIAPIHSHRLFQTITETNQFIMETHRFALEQIIGSKVTVEGHTDLTLNGMKFSGNSQRRKRSFLLFHGAFLTNFDITLIEKILRVPQQQPAYRKGRTHGEFVANVGLGSDHIQAAIENGWSEHFHLNRNTSNEGEVSQRIEQLVREKYANTEWNFRA